MAKKKRTPTPRQVFEQAIDKANHLLLQNGLKAIKRSEGKGRAELLRTTLGESLEAPTSTTTVAGLHLTRAAGTMSSDTIGQVRRWHTS